MDRLPFAQIDVDRESVRYEDLPPVFGSIMERAVAVTFAGTDGKISELTFTCDCAITLKDGLKRLCDTLEQNRDVLTAFRRRIRRTPGRIGRRR